MTKTLTQPVNWSNEIEAKEALRRIVQTKGIHHAMIAMTDHDLDDAMVSRVILEHLKRVDAKSQRESKHSWITSLILWSKRNLKSQ